VKNHVALVSATWKGQERQKAKCENFPGFRSGPKVRAFDRIELPRGIGAVGGVTSGEEDQKRDDAKRGGGCEADLIQAFQNNAGLVTVVHAQRR